MRESEPVIPNDWNVLPIIDEREEFELEVVFLVSGLVWTDWILVAAGGEAGIFARIEVSADGASGHISSPPKIVPLSDLAQAGNTYTCKYIVPKDTITKNGVYNFEAMITFENSTGDALHGLLGFTEGLRLMIHERKDDVFEGTS